MELKAFCPACLSYEFNPTDGSDAVRCCTCGWLSQQVGDRMETWEGEEPVCAPVGAEVGR